jgi:glutathione S-transferase
MRLYDYPASPNCYKVRLAMAEVGLEYERVPIDIFGGDTLTDDFARKNPARTTPVLEIDDGRYLVESNAILLYLTEGTELLPDDKEARAEAYSWLFYEQARVASIIGRLRLVLSTGRRTLEHEGTRSQRRMGVGVTALLAQHLEERDWFVGDDFTVADLALYGYMQVAGEAGIDTSRFPRLEAWLERVRERPRHVADLQPLPDNARPGKGRSIWDLIGL